MTTNRFVNQPDHDDDGFKREFDKLVIESIQFYGHDIKYLERTLVNEDTLFGEDTISAFNDSKTIEVYIESVDGFEGDNEFISNFGLEIRDQIVFTMSQTRWFEETGKTSIPNAGDLIYMPLANSIFEIRFVDEDSNFYQQNKNYIYRITCEKFDYSYETFDTGIQNVDGLNDTFENLDDSSNDPFADNINIQTEGDSFHDFTEDDPFNKW